MNELSEGPKQQHLSDIDSTYILNTEQNYSSKSNTTNSSSSSNSLTFNEDEEDDIYCQNNEEDKVNHFIIISFCNDICIRRKILRLFSYFTECLVR